MRWSIAATTVLAQVLPASTRESTISADQLSHIQDHVQLKSSFPRTVGKTHPLAHRVKRMKRLSTFTDYAQVDEAKNGALRNKKVAPQDMMMKECDPKSDNVDVGILSCGPGRYCQSDADSSLGGVCAAMARGMASSGPCSSSYPYKCDCSNVNNKTYSGNAVCEDIPYICYPGCSDYCLGMNVTITLQKGTPVYYQGCYNFTWPYRAVFCYTYNPSAYDCTYTINGVNCTSCTATSFDCTNVPNGTKGTVGKAFPIPIMAGYAMVQSYKTCAPTTSPIATPPSDMPSFLPSDQPSGIPSDIPSAIPTPPPSG